MSPAGFIIGRIAVTNWHLSWQQVHIDLEASDMAKSMPLKRDSSSRRNPDTVRAPDVAFVTRPNRAAHAIQKKTGFFERCAQTWSVEVISPNETMDDIEEQSD